MKSLDPIEKQIQTMTIDPRSEMRSKVLDEALMLQRTRRRPCASDPNTWRLIMKSKLTQLTIAAIIVLGIGMSLHLAAKTGSKVWAIEQSIEAMRNYRGIRFSCQLSTMILQPIYSTLGIQDSPENPYTQFEIWLRADETISRSTDFKLVFPGKLVAVGGQKRQKYVQLSDGTTYDAPSFNIWLQVWPTMLLKELTDTRDIKELRDLEEIQEQKDTWTKLVGVDSEAGKERLYLKGNSLDANQSYVFEFDVETKLLVSITFWLDNTNHQGLPSGEIHEIVYYEDLPDRVFEIDLPPADQITLLNWPSGD